MKISAWADSIFWNDDFWIHFVRYTIFTALMPSRRTGPIALDHRLSCSSWNAHFCLLKVAWRTSSISFNWHWIHWHRNLSFYELIGISPNTSLLISFPQRWQNCTWQFCLGEATWIGRKSSQSIQLWRSHAVCVWNAWVHLECKASLQVHHVFAVAMQLTMFLPKFGMNSLVRLFCWNRFSRQKGNFMNWIIALKLLRPRVKRRHRWSVHRPHCQSRRGIHLAPAMPE